MGQAILDKRARDPLASILVGAGVPGLTGRGKVVSSFTGAVNIRHNQGVLISIVQDPRAMTYLSVCVPSLFRSKEKSPVPGERVRFDGHRLITEDFVVDLRGRPTWQGTITLEDVKGFDVSKISPLREALRLKGKDGGFFGVLCDGETGNPFVRKAREVLSKVRNAASRAEGLSFLSDLVGLGPGSTPSGDDFISGVLLGEETLKRLLSPEVKAIADTRGPVIPCPSENEGLWVAVNKTNDAGRTLLWQALQGRFPNYLIQALRSVSESKSKQEIAEAVERAANRGATSGTDALTGFLFSVEGRL
ncbi:MAG: DUF2877 domain-containing protein [Deltaproteobacteria bacterium]